MSMAILITTDVPDRFRGLISGHMLELKAGLYLSPDMNARTRDELWSILSDWHRYISSGSIALIFPNSEKPGGLDIKYLGEPVKEIAEFDGLYVTRMR